MIKKSILLTLLLVGSQAFPMWKNIEYIRKGQRNLAFGEIHYNIVYKDESTAEVRQALTRPRTPQFHYNGTATDLTQDEVKAFDDAYIKYQANRWN